MSKHPKARTPRLVRNVTAASFEHLQPLARLSVLGAGTSGLLLVLSFPKFNLLPLAAVALLPLLLTTAKEASAKRRFLGGYLAGVVFFAGTCYWIYNVQRDYGGLSVPAAAGVFALFCGVLAFYFSVFSWLAGYLWRLSWGPAAIPLLWVALEYARTHLMTGFPWLLVGYALTDNYPLARLAQWTGVYGLSYLLVGLTVACIWLLIRPGALATMHLLAVVGLFCWLSISAVEEQYAEDQRAFLVQTNIPQDTALTRWDVQTQAPLLNRLRELTVRSVRQPGRPALVVWPEVPVPFYYGNDSFTRPYAEQIARQTKSYFLMGIVGYAAGSDRQSPTNSAVLLDPSGKLISQYDKIHLVPFGEYVPLRRWLTIVEKVTAEVGDFVPGEQLVVSTLPGGKMSILICYEAIFPDLVRRFVHEGAQVLVNISNDGWYGSSAARYQHLLMARMRAIENHRFVLRATNNGITAVIRPDGQLADQIPPDRAGVLQARWSFETDETFYTRHGDWFAWIAGVVALLALITRWSDSHNERASGRG
ncbi:MAG: apolipoprotein N-acyltransferase [Acidobacteria bacterium]|nr:apolipoprotein N-acyltransferase [Acidobacteriota bacterium]